MLINFGREYCLCGNVGFPIIKPTYEAAIALDAGPAKESMQAIRERKDTYPVPWRSEVQILYQVITRGLHENSGAFFKIDPSSRTNKNRFKEGTILTTPGSQREDRNTGSTPFDHGRPQTMSPHRALR